MPSTGPQITAQLLYKSTDDKKRDATPDTSDDEDDYAPELPPDMLAAPSKRPTSTTISPPAAVPSATKKAIGPSMPTPADLDNDSGDSDDDIGPMPAPVAASEHDESDAVRKFMEIEEHRRKEIEEAAKPKALKREEWMLVPPTSGELLGSLSTTKPRQFSTSTRPRGAVDSSLWTETPLERQQRIKDEVEGKRRRVVNAEDVPDPEERKRKRQRAEYEQEVRKGVEEHTKKVRGAALVDTHLEKMKNTKNTEPQAIWDRERDMSLGGRLMDERSRGKMLKDAGAGLGSRFGSASGGSFL
ncbi:hypothetical protein FISHEDRAFT_34199 [Fistulina hepatica ATCC 64428]|uniref:DUF3752 domain-containing protein n=1 Tax=Fistulina hepatica ATCC 64428 TaxID=1128425 RepID=A0A0D7AMA3_9AGAR|nr:hypothetical protein FISHEDRAFT_34199 [Fistulina hepatica ATCC 64428]